MKYVVEVDGERFDVELDGDSARVNGGPPTLVNLVALEGSPVRLLETRGAPDTLRRVIARRDGAKGRYVLRIDGWRFAVEALDERTRAIRDLSNAGAATIGSRPLVAPMPGMIVRVHVVVGEHVEAGQGLVVMEAMKMENELRSSASGVVKALPATVGRAVEKGAVLVEFD